MLSLRAQGAGRHYRHNRQRQAWPALRAVEADAAEGFAAGAA